MKKNIVLFLCWFATSYSQITVVEDSLFSPSINSIVKFFAVLPDGYTRSSERYSTLYLLHGFSGSYNDWVKNTDLVKYLRDYKYIVITPDAKNSWYANSPVEAKANYEDFLLKDVLPYVEKKYRTAKTKYRRAVAGLSMGGYGAIKFGIKYSELFCFAAGLSAAIQFPNGMEDSVIMARRSKESVESVKKMFGFPRNEKWKENDVYELLEKSNVKTLPYFYISVGSQDGIPEIIEHAHAFPAALRKKGAAFEMHEYAGGHDWKFWDKEIETVLKRMSVIVGKSN